ncbi:MAG: DUF4157 domain-containing protein, partial [Chloroflexota bacterium]
MSTQQRNTDTKNSTDKATKTQQTPQQPNVATPEADVMLQNAEPGKVQRAIGLPGGNGIRRVNGIQRRYGNNAARGMVARRPNIGQTINRVTGNKTSGQPLAVQRDSDDPYGGMEVGSDMESSIESKRGTGDSLPENTQNQMEGGFGTDFSGVNVHNDAESHSLNRDLNARAFTTGNDVFFGEGEYNPGSGEGQELIAHELTHVVQQGGSDSNPQAKLVVNEPGDEFEQEADQTAKEVMTKSAGNGVSSGEAGPDIRREDDEEEEVDPEQAKAEAKEAGKEAGQDAAPSTGDAKETEPAPPPEIDGEPKTYEVPPMMAPPNPILPEEEDLEDHSPEIEAEGKSAAPEAADAALEQFTWANNKPPNWDAAVAQHQVFGELFGEDRSYMDELRAALGFEDGDGIDAAPIVNTEDSDPPADATEAATPHEAETPKPDPERAWTKPGWASSMAASATGIGPVIGSMEAMINGFAALDFGTILKNPFSFIATVLDLV